MQQLNTSRNIPGMAMLSAMLCVIGGGIIALVAWDELWLIVGVLFGVIVALYLLLTETSHLRQIEVKEIEFNHKKQFPPPPPVIDVTPTPKPPQLPPPPNIMRPRSEMIEIQTGMRNSQRFVLPQVEPEQGNGIDLGEWPEDTKALKIAFELMRSCTPPTRKNFALAGMNSGSRYDRLRPWLVGAGLAKDFGDGNTTNWTSDAYNPDVQNTIKNYLTLSPTLAE